MCKGYKVYLKINCKCLYYELTLWAWAFRQHFKRTGPKRLTFASEFLIAIRKGVGIFCRCNNRKNWLHFLAFYAATQSHHKSRTLSLSRCLHVFIYRSLSIGVHNISTGSWNPHETSLSWSKPPGALRTNDKPGETYGTNGIVLRVNKILFFGTHYIIEVWSSNLGEISIWVAFRQKQPPSK